MESFLAAAASRTGEALAEKLRVTEDIAQDVAAACDSSTGFSAPVASIMRADLAAGRLSMADYAREARMAGVPAVQVAEALKQHAAAKEAAAKEAAAKEGVGIEVKAVPPADDVILPPGTYYGRTHATAVHVVDGILVPVAAEASPCAAAEPGSVEASLIWLRSKDTWGARAAERLGPENDFLPELTLHDTSRAGRMEGGKIGGEGAMHIAIALSANDVLTSLDLSCNQIGGDGAAHIARALLVNSTLIELNLSDNELGDAAALRMAAALRTNQTLLALDLRGNGIIEEATREELYSAWGSRDQSRLHLLG
eukprot:CAMPEP_0119319206 /NCGR_PEP_ID=MMETSP1333-20130426/48742_1 /TAXON_ID=418940 /ORGANISM="Scyphosphaera apsteinii, Strain RCC1455" /LENGTH=310 /DNA_ID=CAMNT_0007325561 /DNA_START=46 /DNA_END=978 /DNA_ORIENTATION=-